MQWCWPTTLDLDRSVYLIVSCRDGKSAQNQGAVTAVRRLGGGKY